jgi:tetratricopeptide (TPR) repeat protein
VAFSASSALVGAGTADGTVFLWDSNTPVGGYEARETGRRATKLVDDLHEKHSVYHDVINNLSGDRMSDSSVCKLALQIANSRQLEDAEMLRGEAWSIVVSPDKTIETYRAAFQRVEEANVWEPNDAAVLSALGGAHYRLGAYEDALKTLTRSARMLSDAGEQPDPGNLAFKAMALHKIGRTDEAKAALDQLRELCKTEQYAECREGQALLAEADGLIEGGRK